MMPDNVFHGAAAVRTRSPGGGSGQNPYAHWESQYVDARPVRGHIAKLRRAGMTDKQIARLCAVSPSTIQVIMASRTNSCSATIPKVLRSTAGTILALKRPPAPQARSAQGPPVSALGTTRRLRALVAAGYTPGMLSRELGIAPMHAYALFGHPDTVPAATAQMVADLFDRLEMTPGPSDRARALAHKLGWAPPLAWDEDGIDHADTHPAPAPASVTQASFLERYRELRELGVHDESAIARRLGVKVGSLQRQVARHRAAMAL